MPARLCRACARSDRTSALPEESGSSEAGSPGTEASSTHTPSVTLVSTALSPGFSGWDMESIRITLPGRL